MEHRGIGGNETLFTVLSLSPEVILDIFVYRLISPSTKRSTLEILTCKLAATEEQRKLKTAFPTLDLFRGWPIISQRGVLVRFGNVVWVRILFKASYFNRTKFIMMSCSKNFSSMGDLFSFLGVFAGLFFVQWLDWIFNGAQPQSLSIKSTSPLTNT